MLTNRNKDISICFNCYLVCEVVTLCHQILRVLIRKCQSDDLIRDLVPLLYLKVRFNWEGKGEGKTTGRMVPSA